MRKNKKQGSWEARIPEGFVPVVMFAESEQREVAVGLLRLPGAGTSRETRTLEFQVSEDLSLIPTLPLRARGLFWHEGWDIPTVWAVDGAGVCWMDNAHGHSLAQCSGKQLLGNCENENERRALQRIIPGMTVERPSWVLTALAAGWTPPEGWVDP